MRPKSLVWLACSSVGVLVLLMVLAAGGGYAPEGRAGGDPAYGPGIAADPAEAGYPGAVAYDLGGVPLEAEPVVARRHAPPGSWVGIVGGLAMLGLVVFLGILALRGTADNVVRLRNARD